MEYKIVEVDDEGNKLRVERDAILNTIPGTGDLIADSSGSGYSHVVDSVVHHNFIVEPEKHSVTINIKKLQQEDD